jgi:hypothetical protein
MDIVELTQIVCNHPPGHPTRQKALNQLIRLITPKLYRDTSPDYPDALQQTWEYFLKGVCSKYDATQASLATWLNHYLKWRLHDLVQARADRLRKTLQPLVTADGTIDPIDNVPAPPDLPPILEATRDWAIADADGSLTSRHIRGYPQITAQLLILRRLPPETRWEDLAQELGVTISTLSAFYQRKCWPLLRKFGEEAGYL